MISKLDNKDDLKKKMINKLYFFNGAAPGSKIKGEGVIYED